MFFTKGERALLFASGAAALCGACLTIAVISGLRDAAITTFFGEAIDVWIAFAGAVGAGAATYLARNWLGQPGILGKLKTIFGGTASIWVASVITGSLILPVYGTMFGPLALLNTLIASPVCMVVWAIMITYVHHQTLQWRRERDAIFEAALAPIR